MSVPWPHGDDTVIQWQQENPKRIGSSSYARYEKYKRSRTVREAKKNGAESCDFKYDHLKGFFRILDKIPGKKTRVILKTKADTSKNKFHRSATSASHGKKATIAAPAVEGKSKSKDLRTKTAKEIKKGMLSAASGKKRKGVVAFEEDAGGEIALPADAPAGHEAHTKCVLANDISSVRRGRQTVPVARFFFNRVWFRGRRLRKKGKFDIPIEKCGSTQVALRIARACYVKFVGEGKFVAIDDLRRYRSRCIQAARQRIVQKPYTLVDCYGRCYVDIQYRPYARGPRERFIISCARCRSQTAAMHVARACFAKLKAGCALDSLKAFRSQCYTKCFAGDDMSQLEASRVTNIEPGVQRKRLRSKSSLRESRSVGALPKPAKIETYLKPILEPGIAEVGHKSASSQSFMSLGATHERSNQAEKGEQALSILRNTISCPRRLKIICRTDDNATHQLGLSVATSSVDARCEGTLSLVSKTQRVPASPKPDAVSSSRPCISSQSLSFNSSTEKCSLCYDDVPAYKAVWLRCQHGWYCVDCMERHVEARLGNGFAWPQSCPECWAEVPERDLKRIISKNLMDSLLTRSLEQAVSAAPDLRPCPTPNCVMRVALDAEDSGHFKCPECKKECCIRCGAQPYHKDLTCEEHAAHSRKACDGSLQQWMKETGARQCPSCKMGVTKYDLGNQNTQVSECHKMLCRNCGVRFCFKCLAILTEEYTCGCTKDEHGFVDPISGEYVSHLKRASHVKRRG